ncbi:MAG TPA: hypothetical protein VHB77_20535 [Planctomycetaceae bacterium]|nr:hypothetical protein [Planctomycetaceae bacterium]
MLWLMTAVLLADPQPNATLEAQPSAVQTGTLLVSRGDCLAIRAVSQSPYTHVGTVVMRHGEPLVYDSMNGIGVRCLTLPAYLDRQKPARLDIYRPTREFTEDETDAFEKYLDSQLGRTYNVRQHVTGEDVAGIHCAEYVTEALVAADLVSVKDSARVSPGSLVDGLTEGKLYQHALALDLHDPRPATNAKQGWCRWAWTSTKNCTVECCSQVQRWFCCK